MIQPSDTNAAKQPRLMGSRTISLAATVCQVRHVFRTLRRSSPTLLLWHCHFPKDLWASPQICNFSSSKLPKFPLLGPGDSMSIGPSHIPSFVQNVVSRHLPASNNSGAWASRVWWQIISYVKFPTHKYQKRVGPPFPVIELIVTTRILHS